MRMSDWSSDVCSSDLRRAVERLEGRLEVAAQRFDDRAEGIGDELDRERLTTRPVGEDNVVTGEHVRATLNQADGGSLGKIEAGDAEAGKGLQLARIGLAILVRIQIGRAHV